MFSGEAGYGWLQCDNMICFQDNLVPDNYNVTEIFKAFIGANTAQHNPAGIKHLNSSSKFDLNYGRTMRLLVRTGLGTFGIDIKPKKRNHKWGIMHGNWGAKGRLPRKNTTFLFAPPPSPCTQFWATFFTFESVKINLGNAQKIICFFAWKASLS